MTDRKNATKPYLIIIQRTIEVAVECQSDSAASLRRDMKQCQANFEAGDDDELFDLYHQGVDQWTRFDEIKIKGVEPKEIN